LSVNGFTRLIKDTKKDDSDKHVLNNTANKIVKKEYVAKVRDVETTIFLHQLAIVKSDVMLTYVHTNEHSATIDQDKVTLHHAIASYINFDMNNRSLSNEICVYSQYFPFIWLCNNIR
jgi:hypothetical protein